MPGTQQQGAVWEVPIVPSWSPVPANGHTLIDAICSPRDDIVELIGHAPRTRDIGHAAWAVQLGGQDVVQHPACIPDLKAPGLDASDLEGQKQQSGRKGELLVHHRAEESPSPVLPAHHPTLTRLVRKWPGELTPAHWVSCLRISSLPQETLCRKKVSLICKTWLPTDRYIQG